MGVFQHNSIWCPWTVFIWLIWAACANRLTKGQFAFSKQGKVEFIVWMCPGGCPADATRYRSGGKSFKTTVCTAERRSNPEKQDQRGAKHTYNQTQRQTNSTEPFTCVTKVCWQAVMATCKWAIIGLWRVITLLWFLHLLRYGSFFHIRLWWEGRTTKHLNTHTLTRHCSASLPLSLWI